MLYRLQFFLSIVCGFQTCFVWKLVSSILSVSCDWQWEDSCVPWGAISCTSTVAPDLPWHTWGEGSH